MTFAEFQATRRWSDDIGEALPDYYGDTFEAGKEGKGYVYSHFLIIEQVQPWWPDNGGQWYLRLCNEEYTGDDLADLERQLYDYAVSEEIVS